MTTVSMDLVKELREKTQVGMMACKQALEEAGGDIEKATELLRKRGAAVAAKRADNETNHGRIEAFIAPDHKMGTLVKVACETDFSANTEDLKKFAVVVAEQASALKTDNVAVLLEKQPTIQRSLDELVAKISEKIIVSSIAHFKVDGNGIVNAYIHPGSTVGVLIQIDAEKAPGAHLEELKQVAKDICMQIAVNNPLAVRPDELDPVLVAKERALATESMQDSKKPANIIEKIIDGKVQAFYKEVCLVSQPFIKDQNVSVQQHLDACAKQMSNNLTIKRFARFAIAR